jgi:glutaredoxin
VKNWFSERNIRIEEYNIASDPRKAEEMLRKSGQMGVPVTDVNGEIVIGFNQIALERALRR